MRTLPQIKLINAYKICCYAKCLLLSIVKKIESDTFIICFIGLFVMIIELMLIVDFVKFIQ